MNFVKVWNFLTSPIGRSFDQVCIRQPRENAESTMGITRMKLPALAALIGVFIFSSAEAASNAKLPLTVVDSTGKTVGQFGAPNLVYMNINDLFFATPLGNRDNTFASGQDFAQFPLYYETTNCSGTTYISVQVFGVRSAVLAKVGGLNGQAIAFIASGDLSQRIWRSSLDWNGTNYSCSSQGNQVEFLYPATPVDVTTMFPAPLRIQ